MPKGLYQYLRSTLTMAFERHLAVEDFTAMDQHTANSSLINIMKRKWAKVPGKLYQLYKSLNLFYKEHFTYYCILLFLSNKPSS